MAQYGKNFYGSTYYGETEAFSGKYTTSEIDTDEDLVSTFTVNIDSIMPHVVYGPQSPEISQQSGTWTWSDTTGKLASDSASAELLFRGTCDRLAILYEQRTSSAEIVNVEVKTYIPGSTPVTTTYQFSTRGTLVNSNARYEITGLTYGIQEVRIYLSSTNPAGAFFYFKGVDAKVTDFTVETRARKDSGAWTEWMKISITETIRSGIVHGYRVTGTSPNYAGKNRIQVRLWLASSDYEESPEVENLETIAGDSTNRTEDGRWEAVFNMTDVAEESALTFSKVLDVSWVAQVPQGTYLTVRSQSSPTNTEGDWTAETAPYKLNVKRIRLKGNRTDGWIDTPIISPNKENVRTVRWDTWNDQSFLPYNPAGAEVKYIFMGTDRDEDGDNFTLTNPMLVEDKTMDESKVGAKELVVRIRLKRDNTVTATPVVDWINLSSLMEYKQDKDYEKVEFSAVDFNNTGKGIVTDLTTIKDYFKPPVEAGAPSYELHDLTGRVNDVILYLDSEKDDPLNRRNTTSYLDQNRVWAETKERVEKHYQYGGGDVQHPQTDEVEIAPSFTRKLNDNLRYRYHLKAGWPTLIHTVKAGDTWESMAEKYDYTVEAIKAENPDPLINKDGSLMQGYKVKMPNNSDNAKVQVKWKNSAGTETKQSAHNGRLDGSGNVTNDSIVASVVDASMKGEVDWTSGEKIYDGVINLNDIRKEYDRTHSTPSSGDSMDVKHVVVAGETYASISSRYGIYEEDLRLKNDARDDEEPTEGETIMVPSKIVLPYITPEALVAANPYQIEIVYNSVKTKAGKRLPEDSVFPVNTEEPLSVEYTVKPSTVVTVTRGPVMNGKDLIPNPRVTKINSIKYNGVTYNPWDEFTGTGDYRLIGNYIHWSPTGGVTSEPTAGDKYTVDFECEVPKNVRVRLDTDYKEEGGVDKIWRSPEVKVYDGICYPGRDNDFVLELPSVTDWEGVSTSGAEDFEFVVEDTDLWVKTWIEKNENTGIAHLIGSLQDRIPSKNWFPTINTGYYYLGKEEYYLFSEPIEVEPSDREMPMAKNVDFVAGKFDNAAQIQEASSNLVLNSGFDVTTTKQKTFKLTF